MEEIVLNQKLDRNIIEYLLASLDSSLRGDADIDRFKDIVPLIAVISNYK